MPTQRRNAWNNPLRMEMRRKAPYYLRKPVPTTDRETFLAQMGNNAQHPRRVSSMPNLRPSIVAREINLHGENIEQVTGMTAEMTITDEDHENQASTRDSNDLNGAELLPVLHQQGNRTQGHNEELRENAPAAFHNIMGNGAQGDSEERREQAQIPFNSDQYNGAQGHELHGPETDEILFVDARNDGVQVLDQDLEQDELQAGLNQFPISQDIGSQVSTQEDEAPERQTDPIQFSIRHEGGCQNNDAEESDLQTGQTWMTIDQLKNILGHVNEPHENDQVWFRDDDYEEIATIPDDLSYQGDSESEDSPAPDFSMQMDAYYFETADFALDIEPTIPIPVGVILPHMPPELGHHAIFTNSINVDHHAPSPIATNVAASALTRMANEFDDIIVDYPNPSLQFFPGLTIMPPITTPDDRTGWYCCQCGRFHNLRRAVCGGCKLTRCGACAIMNATVVEEKDKIKRETKGQWSCCKCYTFNDAGARGCVACDSKHCHQCIRIPSKPKKRTKDGRSTDYFERKEENYDGFMT